MREGERESSVDFRLCDSGRLCLKTDIRVLALVSAFSVLGYALMAVWGVLPQVEHRHIE